MGIRREVEEGVEMRCRVCGGALRRAITDLPFKVGDRSIVILKNLPVEQCEACSEYVIGDEVFAKVEALLAKVDVSAELEIIPFAA